MAMKNSQRVSELRTMSPDQLQDELLKLKKEQFNLRFQRGKYIADTIGAA